MTRPSRIEFDNIVFPCLANALIALKTGDWGERRMISKMATYSALSWAELRPNILDPYFPTYKKDIWKWAIPLVAQRFAAQPSDVDYPYKLELGIKLIQTGTRELVWVNHDHDQYFGMCACSKHNMNINSSKPEGARGENVLGKIMMMVRRDLAKNFEGDLDGENCSHCYTHCKKTVKQGSEAIIYWSDGRLCRYVACERHVSTVAKHAKRHATPKKIAHVKLGKGTRTPFQPRDDDEEEWSLYQECWTNSVNPTYYTYTPSPKNWNVLVFDVEADEMVEAVLESK